MPTLNGAMALKNHIEQFFKLAAEDMRTKIFLQAKKIDDKVVNYIGAVTLADLLSTKFNLAAPKNEEEILAVLKRVEELIKNPENIAYDYIPEPASRPYWFS